MQILLGQKNSIYTTTLDTTAKTLKIANVLNFDLGIKSLVSIYSITANKAIPIPTGTTVANVPANGLPVWVYTFPSIPAGVANGDTLNVIIDIPQNQSAYAVLLAIAGATV